eukprot:TRINITY_DN7422_c0_g1_i1.p1 TRINITY_DN7422_c0_g1~~TRINITY_DN7422_c0_g1_i1.p1  ORF type:complete len:526 (+),score=92.32 TRINITY_DN7422_c0_g1_i1:64-1641(+)
MRAGSIVLLALGLLVIFSTSVQCAKKYYDVLGVPETATKREIGAAFRKLSQLYHPDKNPSEEAHDKFVEISEAYQVLSDEDRRQKYDQFGEEGLKGGQGFQDPFNVFQNVFRGGSFSFKFGGGQGGGQGRRQNFGRAHHGHQGQQQEHAQEKIYTENDGVIFITSDNIDKMALSNPEFIWMITFYKENCKPCRESGKEFKTVAQDLKGMIRFGVVDVTHEKSLANMFDVTEVPHTILLPFGEDKRENAKVFKLKREAKYYSGFALREIPNFVTILREGNVDSFLGANVMPKVLLFTTSPKRKVPSIFRALSKDYRTRMEFGIVFVDIPELMERFQLALEEAEALLEPREDSDEEGASEYPKILVLDKKGADKKLYRGPSKYLNIRRFLYRHITERKEDVPKKDVYELKAENQQLLCSKNLRFLCVISFLPTSTDATSIDHTYQQLMNRYSQSKFQFLYVTDETNEAFKEEILNGKDSPVVVWNPRRNKALYYTGNYNFEELTIFLDRILGGDLRWNKLDQVPTLS